MPDTHPSLEGFEEVLEQIASDLRLPENLPQWIRASLRTSGWKLQILRHVLNRSCAGDRPPSILDVGAQFGSLAIYAAKLGCCVAAVDYGPHAGVYREIASDHGVDYRECDRYRSRTVRSTSLPTPT
jgi:predicted RNA methylase